MIFENTFLLSFSLHFLFLHFFSRSFFYSIFAFSLHMVSLIVCLSTVRQASYKQRHTHPPTSND